MVLKATDRKRLVVFLYSFLRKDKVNSMKKLFISQPMRGKSDEDIQAERKKAIELAQEMIGEPVEVIDSFFQEARCRDAPDAGKAKGFSVRHRVCSVYARDFLDGVLPQTPATPLEPQDFALPAGKIQVLHVYQLSCKI